MIFNNVKLSEITSKIGDGLHGSPIYDDNGEYYFINGNNLSNGIIEIKPDTKRVSLEEYERNKRDLGDKTILISINGTLGNIAKYNGEQVILGKSACYLNFKDDVNIDYMRFYFMSPSFQEYLKTYANGSTIKNVPLSAIRECEIRIPSNEFQNKIVSCLKSIDDKIKLNNEINNNLYELGDALYKNYYSQYDGNLPDSYTYKNLNEVSTNLDAKRKPMSSRERQQHKGIYPYYGATSIIDYVDNYIFDDTYLLMGEDGTVKTDSGNPVLQYIWGKNWINNHAHVLKGTNISTEHLLFALRKVNIEPLITGAVQPKINQENMNKIQVIIGPSEINEKFEKLIKPIMEKSKMIVEENKILEQLRDTLLPKLMNGEIDLDNIEI